LQGWQSNGGQGGITNAVMCLVLIYTHARVRVYSVVIQSKTGWISWIHQEIILFTHC